MGQTPCSLCQTDQVGQSYQPQNSRDQLAAQLNNRRQKLDQTKKSGVKPKGSSAQKEGLSIPSPKNEHKDTIITAKSNTQTIIQVQDPISLKKRQEQFLANQLKPALQQSNNIQELLNTANLAQELQLFQPAKKIYTNALIQAENMKRQFSTQSIEQIKAQIYSELTSIAIAQKNEVQADKCMTRARQCYRKTIVSSTVQERIALLNNYSIFKKDCGRLQDAKRYLLEGLDLMRKYYTIDDDRKYVSLVNLACICLESSQLVEANRIISQIKSQCRDGEIVRLAEENRRFYGKE